MGASRKPQDAAGKGEALFDVGERTPGATGKQTAKKRELKAQREGEQEAFLRAIPQKMWVAWSGRPAQILLKQAQTYGIPFAGKPGGLIDLPEVVRALHDFLAANAHALAAIKKDGAGGGVVIQSKQVDLRRKQIELAEIEGALVRLDVMTHTFLDLALDLGRALEQVRGNIGVEPLMPVYQALDRARERWAQQFRQAIPLLGAWPAAGNHIVDANKMVKREVANE